MPDSLCPRPTRQQYRLARLITRWYLDRYHGTDEDVGTASMFCDRRRVGHFAVSRRALARGSGDALFRMLIATTMFQRRQDAQILRVLRGISKEHTYELTDSRRLLSLADDSRCPHLKSNATLLEACDLSKDPVTKQGRCGARPRTPCHLKQHTVLLKRYGHFGKVPTSVALTLREGSADSLAELREQVLGEHDDPLERAVALERRLSKAWRVSDKISAMFLSAVCNPDLCPGLSPWAEGVDWTRYVVIDSNVDLFLTGTGYPGPWTYNKRREFIQRLAKRVDLEQMKPGLQRFNPRIVQQALYLFMSISNRRAAKLDCAHEAPRSCEACPGPLKSLCPSTASMSISK
ncbi:hypothetical protein PPSIR1_38449 [Plesiocystis pacifica SIR-1]|uniref:Uncharacterized protein n=1 Tax=Plesiocystis pacifica SIR-1 TaxID=391625 RepID=A6G8L3_9BACT|nr:hypothetical protein [Plesiocystis pacifica]EDM77790.1 hypothetical protein PPSIR1_38449 [Plesiocystis pacifica SIR-1]